MELNDKPSWPKAIAGIVFLITVIGFGTVHAMPPDRADKVLAAMGLPTSAEILDNLCKRGDARD